VKAALVVLFAVACVVGCREQPEPARWQPVNITGPASDITKPASGELRRCDAPATAIGAVKLGIVVGKRVPDDVSARAITLTRIAAGSALQGVDKAVDPASIVPLSGKPAVDPAWKQLGRVLDRHRGGGRVLLILAERATEPGSAAQIGLVDAHGLGMNADSLQDPGLNALHEVLPSPLPAFALVSTRALERLPDAEAAGLIGHELGHAVGLSHNATPGTLMGPSVQGCVPRTYQSSSSSSSNG